MAQSEQADRRSSPRRIPSGEVAVNLQNLPVSMKRKQKRREPQPDVKVRIFSDFEVVGTLVNLSESGLLISTIMELSGGKEIGVHFQIPREAELANPERGVNLLCSVVWQRKNEAPDKMSHLTGLKIINQTNIPNFQAWLEKLPVIIETQAHSE